MVKSALSILKIFMLMTLMITPIDQLTKNYSREHYLTHEDSSDTTIYQGIREELSANSWGESWYVLQLTYVRNHGASWGVFNDLNSTYRQPILIIGGIILVFLLLAIATWLFESGSKNTAVFLVTIVAGSMGNVWDRMKEGYVTDFLALKWSFGGRVSTLPTFNIADIAIVTGLFFMVISLVFAKNPK